MQRIKQTFQQLGVTLRLFFLIVLCLLVLSLLQWNPPSVDTPVPGAYSYQYGIFKSWPWLSIYKTTDLGRLQLFQAISTGHGLGEYNWVLSPGHIFIEALIIAIVIRLIKYFPRK